MSSLKHLFCRTLCGLGLSLGIVFSAQASYSNVFIFGDSLSDTGNVFTASGFTEPPPAIYYQGRLSNGPVWVETLASGLGHAGASTAWLQGGNNFAWAGAFSGTDGIAGPGTGLLSQVFGQWAPNYSVDPNALYVIGIGGNDLRYVDGNNQPAATPYSDPVTLLGNLTLSLQFLISQGAQNFLVTNVPNLGLAPEAAGHRQESTDLVTTYNALLSAQLSAIAGATGASITEFDLFGLITDVVNDAQNGGQLYGMHNGTISCWGNAANCDDSVFFDYLHPTARVHALAGEAALALLAVPEPNSWLLIVSALLLAAWVSRGKRRVASGNFGQRQAA